jgi:hypothetical protein
MSLYLDALSKLNKFAAMVATPTCTRCKRAIPSQDINVAQDVAYCRACNLSYQLSTLTQGGEVDTAVDVNNPPSGAWYRVDGTETVIGATHRSLGTAFGTLLFGLFWNGIVSVFVALALASTLRLMGFATPSWFPAARMNGGPMSWGLTLFLWVFLLPFIAVGVAMIAAFLSSIGGRTEVRVDNSEVVVFSGIGALRSRRQFARPNAAGIRLDVRQWRDSDGGRHRNANIVIELREGKPVKFGSTLTEVRRKFVAAAVRQALGI